MNLWCIALGASYLIGAIPTGFLLVKCVTHQDVRAIGSGNVGATNVTRAAGLRLGLVVFMLDALKGVAAVLLIAPLVLPEADPLTARLACGLATVLGHAFPVFLRFRGGKGVATTIGVLLAAAPAIGLIYLAVWAVCFTPWRYVSAGSLAAALSIPIAQHALHQPRSACWLGLGLAGLIIVRHHENIDRLLHGREHKAGSKPRA